MLVKFGNDIISFWIKTWKENKLLFWAEAAGAIFSMVGASFLAFGSPDPNMILVFAFYLLGSVSLQVATYIRESSWMFLLVSFYTFINVVGIINAI